MSDRTYVQFVVLYTAQKVKKSKTWQDGILKFYDFNRKMVLMDEKGYNIDRKFQKGKRSPQVGDEIEFDGHLVTVENVAQEYSDVSHSNETVVEPTPSHLDTRRRHAQQNAVNKLRAKWKPPTLVETMSVTHVKDERRERNLEKNRFEEREMIASIQEGPNVVETIEVKIEEEKMPSSNHEMPDPSKDLAHSTLITTFLEGQRIKTEKHSAGIQNYENGKQKRQSWSHQQANSPRSMVNTPYPAHSCQKVHQMLAQSTIPEIQYTHDTTEIPLSPQPSTPVVDVVLNKQIDSTEQEMVGVEDDLNELNMEEEAVIKEQRTKDTTANSISTPEQIDMHDAMATAVESVSPIPISTIIPNSNSEDTKSNVVSMERTTSSRVNPTTTENSLANSGIKRSNISNGNEEAVRFY
ncbi:hypothetical protein VKS41_005599 [Umbelopsis sp. WA50703]